MKELADDPGGRSHDQPHADACPLCHKSDRRRSKCDPPLRAATGREQMHHRGAAQKSDYSITSSAREQGRRNFEAERFRYN
jgi:hypothetical protein